MRSVKMALSLFVIALFAVPLFARLSKYKGWESSPEGYFMTKAERAEWAKVDTDADAEKFIADFHAKRPANFEKEVAERASNADKYLTVGKTPGSKGVRGKVIILLGPPTSMDVSERTVTSSEKRDNPVVAGLMSNMNSADSGGGGGGRGGGGTSNNSLGNSMATSATIRTFHFNYQGAIAKTADRKQIDVNVDVDPLTGKDRIPTRSEETDLDSIFEVVAQSWIKK
jgi:GWxTD domain-containing protein